jgi:hypothetical protein
MRRLRLRGAPGRNLTFHLATPLIHILLAISLIRARTRTDAVPSRLGSRSLTSFEIEGKTQLQAAAEGRAGR